MYTCTSAPYNYFVFTILSVFILKNVVAFLLVNKHDILSQEKINFGSIVSC